MKKTIRENIIDLPYGLHDCHINKIEMDESSIQLIFKEGFYCKEDDEQRVHGYLLFENVDFDFCSISVMSVDGNNGVITGTRYEFADFIGKQDGLDLEIVDETYGYNKTKFSGFMYMKELIKEFTIEIYHFGDMIYYAEN